MLSTHICACTLLCPLCVRSLIKRGVLLTVYFYHIAILWSSSFCIAEITSEPLVHNGRPDQRERNDGGAFVAGAGKTPVPSWTEPQEGTGKHFRP